MSTTPQPSTNAGGVLGWAERRKYELLLFGLLQHLFAAMLVPDLRVYNQVVWPINMIVLGVTSVGVFSGASLERRMLRWVLAVIVIGFPAVPLFVPPTPSLMVLLSVTYLLFFASIFVEVLRYMLRPSYVNVDLVSAGLCGYLLLLEVGSFATQVVVYTIDGAYHGLTIASLDPMELARAYLDIEYFCAITLTSIGFGDITPTHHVARLLTAFLGIAGQIYSVVLMGILISKYTSSTSGAAQ